MRRSASRSASSAFVPIADVDDRRDVADDRARVVEFRLIREAHELHPELLVRHLDFDLDLLAAQCPHDVGLDRRERALAEHFRDRPADELTGLQTESRGVRPVDELETVLGVAVRDQHRGAVGHESQLQLARTGGVLRFQLRRDVAIDLQDRIGSVDPQRPACFCCDQLTVLPRVDHASLPFAVLPQRVFDRNEWLG